MDKSSGSTYIEALRSHQQGSRMHSFTTGWMRRYGTEWVPENVWLKIMIRVGARPLSSGKLIAEALLE
jgi:hypothetical protein